MKFSIKGLFIFCICIHQIMLGNDVYIIALNTSLFSYVQDAQSQIKAMAESVRKMRLEFPQLLEAVAKFDRAVNYKKLVELRTNIPEAYKKGNDFILTKVKKDTQIRYKVWKYLQKFGEVFGKNISGEDKKLYELPDVDFDLDNDKQNIIDVFKNDKIFSALKKDQPAQIFNHLDAFQKKVADYRNSFDRKLLFSAKTDFNKLKQDFDNLYQLFVSGDNVPMFRQWKELLDLQDKQLIAVADTTDKTMRIREEDKNKSIDIIIKELDKWPFIQQIFLQDNDAKKTLKDVILGLSKTNFDKNIDQCFTNLIRMYKALDTENLTQNQIEALIKNGVEPFKKSSGSVDSSGKLAGSGKANMQSIFEQIKKKNPYEEEEGDEEDFE